MREKRRMKKARTKKVLAFALSAVLMCGTALLSAADIVHAEEGDDTVVTAEVAAETPQIRVTVNEVTIEPLTSAAPADNADTGSGDVAENTEPAEGTGEGTATAGTNETAENAAPAGAGDTTTTAETPDPANTEGETAGGADDTADGETDTAGEGAESGTGSGEGQNGNGDAGEGGTGSGNADDGNEGTDDTDDGADTDYNGVTREPAGGAFTDEEGNNLKWQVTTGQTIEENAAVPGTYLLTISVTAEAIVADGEKEVAVPAQNFDIVFIVDESGSMISKPSAGNGKTRTQVAQDAMKKMIEETVGNEGVEIAIVGFGNGESYSQLHRVISSFTSDKEELLGAVDKITCWGSTPVDAGLKEADALLIERSSDNTKIVILICDGDFNSVEDANNALRNMQGIGNGDRFYSVAFENGFKNQMQDLLQSVPAGVEGKFFEATAATLEGVIGDIAKVVQSEAYDFVLGGELQTTLSDAMDLYDTSFTLTIRDKNGNVITDENGNPLTFTGDGNGEFTLEKTTVNQKSKVRVEVFTDADGREKVRLKFPANYQLEDGWTYEVTATVKVNDSFAANYTGTIDGTGDPGTGSKSAGQPGVYTSEKDLALTHFTFVQSFEDEGTASTAGVSNVRRAPAAAVKTPVTQTLSLPAPVVQLIAQAVTPAPAPEVLSSEPEYVPFTAQTVAPAEEAEVAGEQRQATIEQVSVLGARRPAAAQEQGGRTGKTGDTFDYARHILIALGSALSLFFLSLGVRAGRQREA